jgi:putative transposase
MKRQGLVAKAAKKYKATTDSDHNLPVAPNKLEQDFSAEAPTRSGFATSPTLWTGEGWLYLAVVLDLFSRMVVGWAMDKRMKAGLVCDALQMALWRRRMPKGVVVHSDRGSQYCSAVSGPFGQAQSDFPA